MPTEAIRARVVRLRRQPGLQVIADRHDTRPFVRITAPAFAVAALAVLALTRIIDVRGFGVIMIGGIISLLKQESMDFPQVLKLSSVVLVTLEYYYGSGRRFMAGQPFQAARRTGRYAASMPLLPVAAGTLPRNNADLLCHFSGRSDVRRSTGTFPSRAPLVTSSYLVRVGIWHEGVADEPLRGCLNSKP